MALPPLNPHTHHLPHRTTTTVLLEDPPYLSLSGDNDAVDAGSLCKGHGENVRCDNCNGGRDDGIVINEIDKPANGGVGIVGSDEDEMCDSDDDEDEDESGDDEDEDDAGEGVMGWDPPSPTSSSWSPRTLMPHDIAVAETGWMVPHPSPPLTPTFTALPPALGGGSLHGWVGDAAAGVGSEDSIMADSCVDMEGCDSGYESALEGGEPCQLEASDARPRDRRRESPSSDVGEGDDFEALYQQLKRQVEGFCGGWQGWVSPGELSSPCESEEEMLGNGTGHSSMVVAAQREARGRMKRSGGKGLMGGGQKMGKVRKGGKQALRKRCDGGHAGVPWVS